MGNSLTRWTVTTLAQHLRGQTAQDANAQGGTVPDRLAQIIASAGTELWNRCDWQFRLERGTLTVLADESTAYLPTDFGEMYYRDLTDPSKAIPLRFYDDAKEFQEIADSYESTDTGAPHDAFIKKSSAIDTEDLTVTAGEEIAQYDLLYVSSWDTANPTVKKADASNISTCRCLYWASAAIVSGADGTVRTYGSFTSTVNNTGDADATAYLSSVTPGITAIAAPTYPGNKSVAVGTFSTTGATATVVLDLSDWRLKWSWIVQLAVASDNDYSFNFWYVTSDPWSNGEITDDTTAPRWPATFNEGWRLLARWKVLDDYSRDADRAETARKRWLEWLTRQVAENDETISISNIRIQEGYDDFGRKPQVYRTSVRNYD